MKRFHSNSKELYTRTTTKDDYYDRGQYVYKKCKIFDDELVESNLLVQGKLVNNLYLTKLPAKNPTEKPHLYAKSQPESYVNFVESNIKNDYPNIFTRNATSNEVCKRIQQMRKETEDRTNYQSCFCRPEDGIVSVGTIKREAQRKGILPPDWLIDTTHQASYRTPDQISKIGDIVSTRSCKPDKEDPLKDILRKLFPLGKSTYIGEYSQLAQFELDRGTYGLHRPGPIDRYTNRKL